MAVSYPPPPPSTSFARRKVRPSIVTKYGIFTVVIGIVAIVIGVVDVIISNNIAATVIGWICIAIGVFFGIICGIGILFGQKWALTVTGYSLMAWTKNPEVVEYFALSSGPAYPPPPP